MMIKTTRQIFCLLLLLVSCDDKQQLASLSDDAVILAFGDSLTFGTGAEENESYPAVLEKQINRKIINAGVPGELSAQGLKRLPRFLDKYQPALLILCHGGNDILQKRDLAKAEANIRQMIALAQNKNIPVLLFGAPKPNLFLKDADLYNKIADDTDIVFIPNLIAEILSEGSLKSDLIHPNNTGYRKMALTLADTLRDNGAL